ncbi:GLPGLI family protein [Kaistella sp. 97-N-M2]|uniref:GLPGLI family protein n=1 Tax=Kaistella sp. 97-N-M2 TaxID=2908645 RepID=UPI001F2823B7|nr:GLPGLI family protein [Kaistella sp. 97-N-M2]UJF30835.1 GLPGLI family protein [Kaistella sp. 97-N-M2]
MRKFALLLVFFGLMVSAQKTRVIYEYRFRPDSTKADSLKTEWMYLDIGKNGSKYYSKSSFESDSVVAASIRKQMLLGSKSISVQRNSQGGEVTDEVEKTYPDYRIYLISTLGNDSYKVLEDRKPLWKISAEKKKISDFEVQKATAEFAGRKWTAWFTTEVPIQDGPYKFSGLPGLIVQISDETGSHKMELKGIKKMTEIPAEEIEMKGKEIPFTKKKPLDVTRKQYVKQLQQYENDPVQGMRAILSRPDSKVKININGKEISDPKEVLRAMEENAREEMRQNNNKIELVP